MAPENSTKSDRTSDLDDQSLRQGKKDEAFPRVPMTETPELDYLSSTSESDFPQVSFSKRDGTMSRSRAKSSRKENKKKCL